MNYLTAIFHEFSVTKFIDNDLNQIGWVDDVLTLGIIFILRIINLNFIFVDCLEKLS